MIDTNILLDWLLDRDASRTARIDTLFAGAKELHIADVALVELAFALESHYELPRDIVAGNIAKVIDEPLFNCNRTMFQRALGEYLQHPALSIVDCCLLQYAELQNTLPLWTFDKKLITQSLNRARTP